MQVPSFGSVPFSTAIRLETDLRIPSLSDEERIEQCIQEINEENTEMLANARTFFDPDRYKDYEMQQTALTNNFIANLRELKRLGYSTDKILNEANAALAGLKVISEQIRNDAKHFNESKREFIETEHLNETKIDHFPRSSPNFTSAPLRNASYSDFIRSSGKEAIGQAPPEAKKKTPIEETLQFPSKDAIISCLEQHPLTNKKINLYFSQKKILEALAGYFANQEKEDIGVDVGIMFTLEDVNEKLKLQEDRLISPATILFLSEALKACAISKKIE